jgi:ATP-binding cassette subfamily C (CFTR/MRP) protein 1
MRGAVRAFNQAISNAVPAIVLVVTLMAYSRSGAPIVASTIFTAISLFNQLRFPLFFYPMLIDSLANGHNSLKRISNYLAQEEIIPYQRRFPSVYSEGGCITMTNGNFLWSSQGKPALCGANLNVKAGEVVAVIGTVGAGKSTLLKALLGELVPMPPLGDAPMVTVLGNIAYCNQEAWVSSGTIKQAVVCGREYNETKYLAAIRDAGLDADIDDSAVYFDKSLAKGILTHDTDVGEGGSYLSGGQRARVALARALYDGDGGVFLLDDVLSALDASVGATVFERLLSRVKKTKSAAVLVTNNPSLPKRCDKVILMGSNDGCASILDIGTYTELIGRGHDLENISGSKLGHDPERDNIRALAENVSEESHTIIDGKNSTIEAFTSNVVTCHADPDGQKGFECDLNFMADHVYVVGAPESEDYLEPSKEELKDVKTDQNSKKVKIMSADESMSTNAVPFSAYLSYLKNVDSPILVLMTVISYLMVNGAQFYQQFVVAKWTEVGKAGAMAVALRGRYLASISKAALVVSTFLWLRSFFLMQVGVKASRRLHTNMLRSVIEAPISFFDATPSGQLISRFGKELDIVDRSLPDGIGAVLVCFLQILTSTVALAGVVSPGMLAPLISVGFFYFKTMSRFRPAARDLKRAETKSRSPIYTHFKEAIRGTEVIRSITGGGRIWSAQHRHLTDENLSVFYTVKSLDRWLSVRLENLGNILVFIGAIASVFLTSNGRMKSGSAGWGLTQSLSITGLLTWAVRCLTDLESQMMSLIRIQEITDLQSTKGNLPSSKKHSAIKEVNNMPKEFDAPGDALRSLPEATSFQMAPCPLQDHALTQSGWPWEGRVQFTNISMRYNKLSPLALRNISFDVKPGTTLALVGRSGSGKSSVLLTLFRLIEIEKGGIYIDGIDIRSVGLKALRASLSIIPQDPTLFAGTLMFNLDATGSASHENAWAALKAASPDLAQFFAGEKGLDTLITEGGKSLSLGQRQLVCLARALLRKDKILILDEATSSVDFKTDAQVQATIRREFVNKGVTVITVAHRLDTVFGYDRIAVIGNGSVLEYGAPQDLLTKRNGSFRQLVIDMNRQEKKSSALLLKA